MKFKSMIKKHTDTNICINYLRLLLHQLLDAPGKIFMVK